MAELSIIKPKRKKSKKNAVSLLMNSIENSSTVTSSNSTVHSRLSQKNHKSQSLTTLSTNLNNKNKAPTKHEPNDFKKNQNNRLEIWARLPY